MTKLRAGLLIAAGVFVLVLGALAVTFYIRVYKPIASPMMAMSVGKVLEERQLKNQKDFTGPASGELSADQVQRFIAVEQAVEAKVAAGRAALATQQANLERANDDGSLSVRSVLAAFGEIKSVLMDAKPAQIEAMNEAQFSKAEFEWVRDQLYRGAGLGLTRIDVSEILAGDRDAVVMVHATKPGSAPLVNQQLAQPLAARLEAWRAFGFFGL